MGMIYNNFIAATVRGEERPRRRDTRDNHVVDVSKLAGCLVCLTGRFDCGTRAEVCAMLKHHGVRVTNRVSVAVDYLIVGSLGSTHWVNGETGRKHAMAERHGVREIREETILRKDENHDIRKTNQGRDTV